MMEIRIKGAKVLFEIFEIKITETQVNSWLVILVIFVLCKWLTHGLKVKPEGKRQIIAEYLVTSVEKLVSSNMSRRFASFAPFIAALLSLSALSSLLSLVTLYPPTADLNTTLGWSILVFGIITFYKIKTDGVKGYLKGYAKPFFLMTPLNIISEVATPVSMAFRHFGNIVSGVVISTLLYAALSSFSSLVLSWLPGFLADIPVFQLGIPGVLSIYFDLFSACLQAFIFTMLTMVYVKMAAGVEE